MDIPVLLQIAVLIVAYGILCVLLAVAWSITKIVREAPETIDRIMYRNTPAPGSLADPVTTARLE